MRSYTEVHVKIFIKGHIIIIHCITSVSYDNIDDVIKFAKFCSADGTEMVKEWHFDQEPFLRKTFFCMQGIQLKSNCNGKTSIGNQHCLHALLFIIVKTIHKVSAVAQ